MKLEDKLKVVGDRASSLYTEIENSITWAESYADKTVKEGLVKTLKKNRREASKLISASKVKPSVGVYGQSQVGKSYLIGSIAKPETDNLLKIKVGDEVLNFISDINPPGGQESTGVVVRFTSDDKVENNDYPIQIELLSFLDVVSVLVNAYHSDLKDWGYDSIIDSLNMTDYQNQILEGNKGGSFLDEDSVNDFCDYLELTLLDSRLVNHLAKSGYLEFLSEHLFTLDFHSAIECLSVLWGKNDFITELVKKMGKALESLEFSKTVYASRSVFESNDDSLVCVERVRELFKRDDCLKTVLANDKPVEISFPLLASLTREVRLVTNHNYPNNDGRRFLKHCDLLDFPGSKSREKVGEDVFNANSLEDKLQLFVRGKVFYLFEHYSSNEGLSSLLYCMDNNPPEDQEAPGRLKKWMDVYVGKDENERLRRINELKESLNKKGINVSNEDLSPLLVVATKFNFEMDKYWQGKEADIDVHEAKWQARFDMNFNKFMSMPVRDKWVESYYGESNPFKYVLPVRDPHYSNSVFSKMENDLTKEKGVREERKEILNAIEASFLRSEYVKRYVPNHFEVWRELSTPNGTGVNQIFKFLQYTTNPELTLLRLNNKLDTLLTQVINMISIYIISGDIDSDLEKARKESIKCWTAFNGATINKKHILANIFNSIKVKDTDIWRLFYKYHFDLTRSSDLENSISSDKKEIIIQNLCDGHNLQKDKDFVSKDVLLKSLKDSFVYLDEAEIEETINEDYGVSISDLIISDINTRTGSSFDGFVDVLISYFNSHLLNQISKEDLYENGNERLKQVLGKILNEIIKSEDRLSLRSSIIESLKLISPDSLNSEDLDLAASSATSLLNEFLFTAGVSQMESSEITQNEKYASKLFSPIGMDFDKDDLKDFDKETGPGRFTSDWAIAFRGLFEQNVQFEYGVKDPSKSSGNARLTEIVTNIKLLNVTE